MLSMTAQYALRALAYIAGHDGQRPVLARDIAAKTGVPHYYLSRILRDATRAGLLESARGVGGGFRLARPSSKIRLHEVLAPFDDLLDRSKCPFGQLQCNDKHACGFHKFWKPISQAYWRMLDDAMLSEVGMRGLAPAGRSRRRGSR